MSYDQEIIAFTQAATTKIDATFAKVEGVADQLVELKERQKEIEQKFDARPMGRFGPATDSTDLAKLVLESDGLEAIRSGETKSFRVAVRDLGLGVKTTVTSASGQAIPAFRDAEMYGPLSRQYSIRDLLPLRPTTAPSIDYLKGVRSGAAAVQVNEGDVKSELGITFTAANAKVATVAVWIPASRQALDDGPMLADYIQHELLDALQQQEDTQLLKGSGTGGYISGLWTNATAYSRAVTGDTPADTLRRAITQIQIARGAPSGIVIHPIGLEMLELEKDSTGRYILALDVTVSNGRTVTWRVPAVVTDALTATEFLVGDFQRAARFYDRQQATVEVSTSHADFFTRNLIAILAEERCALTVPRGDLLVKGTFAST